MPNWCVQNWILRGPKKDVQNFCDIVNSCLTRPDVKPNDFGKFWLGNLCVAFGYDYSETLYGLRGNFDPDESCVATLIHPEAEEKAIIPNETDDETSEIRFSITHAWGPSEWFQEMLDEKYPSLEQAWKATDEFGNFNECRNGEAFGLKRYEVSTWGDKGEDKGFDTPEETAAYLNEFTGMTEDPFTSKEIEELSDSFYDKISTWNDQHDEDYIEFAQWTEV